MNAPDADPRWQAPRAEGAAPAPAPTTRRHDSLLVRFAFVLLFVCAVAVVLIRQGEKEGAEAWVVRMVVAGGVAMACLGLLVPWWRIGFIGRSLHPPGRQLASASRMLGWGALGALPAVALVAPWWANPIAASLPFATLALWRRRPWSAWYWYAVALAALTNGGLTVWRIFQLIQAQSDGQPLGPRDTGRMVGAAVGALVYTLLAYVIARDTRVFQRSLRRV